MGKQAMYGVRLADKERQTLHELIAANCLIAHMNRPTTDRPQQVVPRTWAPNGKFDRPPIESQARKNGKYENSGMTA